MYVLFYLFIYLLINYNNNIYYSAPVPVQEDKKVIKWMVDVQYKQEQVCNNFF